MSKALVSFAIGDHYQQLLEIALPSFQRFATRHGYDLHIPDVETIDGRPASWMKLPTLIAALDRWDEVIWIDADAVIVDDSEDIRVPSSWWQALVRHHTGDGEVPSAGFWLLRKPMLPVIDEMWQMTEHTHHCWWEQAALCDLLGYDPNERPMTHRHDTHLSARTYWLDNGWSVHPNDATEFETARVMQAAPGQNRAAVMREWAATTALAVANP